VVDLDSLVAGGRLPFGGDQALALQAVKGGVERTRVNLQHVPRAIPDELRDPIPVPGAPAQGLQNEEVERALQQLDAGVEPGLTSDELPS
jgi:hypothetical protein